MRNVLLQMEEGFWRAAGDADFYRDHFAEDGHCVFGFGVLDKAQTIASIESAPVWTSFEFDDVAIHRISDDVVSVAYRAHGERGSDRYDAMVSSVYVQRDGAWRLVLHHQIPTAP